MNEIIRHIEYLLVANDCVVIPGLGAVLAHTLPAKYDEDRSYMLPPSRVFSFNSMLTHNDGLLTTSLSRAKGVSFDISRNMICSEVEAMRRELSAKGTLKLGCIGSLVMNDGVMSFVPGRDNVLSPATMWLPQLPLLSLGEIARARAEHAITADIKKRGRILDYVVRAGRIAASLALLVFFGAVLSTPIDVDNAQYASLGIDNIRPAEKTETSKSSLLRRPGEMSSALVLVINNYDDATEQADTAAHNEYVRMRSAEVTAATTDYAEASIVEGLRFDDNDKYCLIVASFGNNADADKYIEQSRDARLGILVKDGRYRIYAATGKTLQQSQAAIEQLSERYPGVWVCRK